MKKVFSFWRVVIAVAVTRGLWTVTTDKEERTFLLAVNIVQKDDRNALEIFAGPFSMIIGIV